MRDFYDDDTVVTVGTITREQLDDVVALMTSITGPLHSTCLAHGPNCEMRRPTCIISTRQEKQ